MNLNDIPLVDGWGACLYSLCLCGMMVRLHGFARCLPRIPPLSTLFPFCSLLGPDLNELVEGALRVVETEKKPRRLKESRSGTTRLPSLMSAKTERHSLSSLRRISRGSQNPRPLDEFSSALSFAIQKHSETRTASQAANFMAASSSLPTLN